MSLRRCARPCSIPAQLISTTCWLRTRSMADPASPSPEALMTLIVGLACMAQVREEWFRSLEGRSNLSSCALLDRAAIDSGCSGPIWPRRSCGVKSCLGSTHGLRRTLRPVALAHGSRWRWRTGLAIGAGTLRCQPLVTFPQHQARGLVACRPGVCSVGKTTALFVGSAPRSVERGLLQHC